MTERSSRVQRVVAAVPVIVLTLVAIGQISLTRTDALVPWKGGGFGMFSSTDSGSRRFVRMYVTAPERSEELALPRSLEDLAARASTLPSVSALERFAEGIAAREARHERPVTVVRVQVWRTSYAVDTLQPEDHLVRELVWDVERTD